MQRRTFLGLAAGAGAIGALGAAAELTDGRAAPPATRAEEPVPATGQRNSPVIAADTRTAGSKTHGTVQQSASVLDLDPSNRYALVTRYRLVPGANETGSEWKTASLTAEHDWNAGSLVSHSGDVVPAEEGNADSNLHLETARSTGRYRWHLTFDTASGDSHIFRFATVVDRTEPPETDDALADAMFGAGFTKELSRATKRGRATARLVREESSE